MPSVRPSKLFQPHNLGLAPLPITILGMLFISSSAVYVVSLIVCRELWFTMPMYGAMWQQWMVPSYYNEYLLHFFF
jgi:hypothetical protein